MGEYGAWQPHELRLLEQALAAADRAAECRRVIAAEGLMVSGRAHPLLRVQVAAERIVAESFKALRLER